MFFSHKSNLFYKGRISTRCPRAALIRQLDELRKLGLTLKTGVERKSSFILQNKGYVEGCHLFWEF